MITDSETGISIPIDYNGLERLASVYRMEDNTHVGDINISLSREDWDLFVELSADELLGIAKRNPELIPAIKSELEHRKSDPVWNGQDFGKPDLSWGIAIIDLDANFFNNAK